MMGTFSCTLGKGKVGIYVPRYGEVGTVGTGPLLRHEPGMNVQGRSLSLSHALSTSVPHLLLSPSFAVRLEIPELRM